MVRQKRLDGFAHGSGGSDGDEFLMRHHEERRTIRRDGLGFAPLPKLAQDSEGRTAQRVAALDAPDGIEVGRLKARGVVNEPGARFLVPGEAAFLLKFKLELVGERAEVMRVV